MRVQVHVHICIYMWRLQADIGYPLWLSTLVSEIVTHRACSSLIWIDWLPSKPPGILLSQPPRHLGSHVGTTAVYISVSI